jgi:hypothetical protein
MKRHTNTKQIVDKQGIGVKGVGIKGLRLLGLRGKIVDKTRDRVSVKTLSLTVD